MLTWRGGPWAYPAPANMATFPRSVGRKGWIFSCRHVLPNPIHAQVNPGPYIGCTALNKDPAMVESTGLDSKFEVFVVTH